MALQANAELLRRIQEGGYCPLSQADMSIIDSTQKDVVKLREEMLGLGSRGKLGITPLFFYYSLRSSKIIVDSTAAGMDPSLQLRRKIRAPNICRRILSK